MITIMEEPANLCIGTLCGLFHKHGKEVVGDAFNLNAFTFLNIIHSGSLHMIVARDENREAVGYACFQVYRDFMRAQDMVADCCAIYVLPEYRGRTSVRMIKEAEKVLKRHGVSRIYMHLPLSKPKAIEMFQKPSMGYEPLETVLQRTL